MPEGVDSDHIKADLEKWGRLTKELNLTLQ